ncbi:sigma-54 interaction domain-containing protein [Chitinimonas lacunae]|uniref:Sigma-54 interaction domain-containing protein n=1 Tax=Chitinimonas lacunae TaxID=1963018 RepID=A0ABV8MM97_9NEIS
MFDAIRHESDDPALSAVFSFAKPGTPKRAMVAELPPVQADEHRFGRLYGASPAMLQVFKLIERVAPSDASVMIVGESGCGKELVAQTIHEMSQRANRPFVALNCGALPANLIEAELFGYEKGAFTGANKTHQGFFERAEGGTLFLDEITEMPLEMQVRLLRVLETGRFNRVGGDREIACDVRVVAATNREPLQAVHDGHLREDVLYRLAVFPIELPPLRERGDDVVLLANRFLEMFNQQYGTDKYFAPDVEELLAEHRWPGNVRELKNCIQRAYIMAEDEVHIDTLTPLRPAPCASSRNANVLEFEVGVSIEEAERRLIFATLDRFQGNKRRTAQVLGVSLKTLYNRLNEYASRGLLENEAYLA